MTFKKLLISSTTLLLLTACNGEKQKESITEGGMKCGPGKCGASMIDGSAALVKKKMSILDQLKEGDSRRECVIQAMSTKEVYACAKDSKKESLSTKSSTDNTKNIPKNKSEMKCQAGKCGSSM